MLLPSWRFIKKMIRRDAPHSYVPKASTRSVNLWEFTENATARQTARWIVHKTTFLDVLMVIHPKPGLISNSIVCTMATLPWDMEVINLLRLLLSQSSQFCAENLISLWLWNGHKSNILVNLQTSSSLNIQASLTINEAVP